MCVYGLKTIVKMAASIRHVRSLQKLLQTANISKLHVDKGLNSINRSQSRFHHILTKNRYGQVPDTWKNKKTYLCAVFIQRYKSNDVASSNIPDYIPEPPLPPPESLDLASTLNAIGEPTFTSLGLGGWSPSGILQNGLEFLHVTCDLPWWGAIMAGTIFIRLCVFPLVIISQRNIVNMHNHMPTIQRLQEKLSEAKNRGDMLSAGRTAIELRDYLIRNNVNPFKNLLVPLCQIPIFLSVFFGLREMSYLPIESMKFGGLFWFTDLTVADPYYLLPFLTMGTLLTTLEVGADGISTSQMQLWTKYLMRGMPVVLFFFVSNFPAAMLCYWCTSNAFSLLQVLFLKIPAVKTFFKIPSRVVHSDFYKPPKKGIRQGLSESWNNSKVANDVENRMRADAIKFKKAGEGPIPKTYAYDPTKKAVNAKSKS